MVGVVARIVSYNGSANIKYSLGKTIVVNATVSTIYRPSYTCHIS